MTLRPARYIKYMHIHFNPVNTKHSSQTTRDTVLMAHTSPNPSPKSRRAMVYHYAADKSQQSIDFLYKYWIDEPGTEVDDRGNTLLHSIVIGRNEEALKALIELVTIQELKKQNTRGDTALHEAARVGQDYIAKILLDRAMQLAPNLVPYYRPLVTHDVDLEAVEEEPGDLVSIQNKMGETPLYVAAASGHKKVFRLLEEYHSDWNTQSEDGFTILHAAVMGGYFHLAMNIFKTYPQLAKKPDKQGNTPLNLLAASPSAFRSDSTYAFRYLGRKPFIPLQFIVILLYHCISSAHDINSEGEPQKKQRNTIVKFFLAFPWLKSIDETKQKHKLAEALAERMIKQEADWSYYSYTEYTDELTQNISVMMKNNMPNPLIQAIQNSIPELVKQILKHCPDSANSIDEKGRNVLHIAAEYKNIIIYELLKTHVVNKERMLAEVDYEGNTILHQTTNLDSTHIYISLGIFYVMCWNVFWFERVKHDCPPYLRHLPNKEGNTAEKLFKTNSRNRREDAGKAMKDINGNLMVVAALIGTISFAALFTVPGSYNQKYGYPLLLKTYKRDVELFLGYDATTLFASTFALGNLLSIQLSRFNVDDFLIALPLKYVVAISAMYYSACFTVATCLQAFILEESLPKYYLGFVSCISVILSLGYIDAAHYVFSYVEDVLAYSLKYKSQEI